MRLDLLRYYLRLAKLSFLALFYQLTKRPNSARDLLGIKRAFSLIELVVCLGLLAFMLGTLFYWHNTFSRQAVELKKIKDPILEERYAYQRLQQILPKAETPFYLAEDRSLVFIFDRGVSSNPELSGKILGRLYHDSSSHTLRLGLWPHPNEKKKSPTETITLIDCVEGFDFDFFYPEDPFKKTVDPEAVKTSRPKAEWQADWKLSYQTLPALVKLTIRRTHPYNLQEHIIEYLFDLPTPIIFVQESA